MEARRLILVLGGLVVALVLVLGGLSLAVLGGGDGNGGSDGDGGATPQPAPESESSPLPERVQGELRLFGPDPISLDPACASDAASAEYIVEIFSGLVSFDRELKLIPDLAEEIPTKENGGISPDGTVYTFKIRKGVKFHDGSRQVTADDFKFSMERSLDPQTLSPVGTVYLDDIVGAKQFAAGDADEVTGIKVVDEFTLEITIDEPKGYFLAKLTYPTAYVVDQREVGGSDCFSAEWTLSPNGTGPFKLDEWQLGQRIVLTPNEGFHLEPRPSLAKVTYVLAGGSPLVMYENDEIDLTGVGINDIERIRDPSEPLNAEFSESPSLDTYYIGFNTQEPPFDDPKVRQAFALALDKKGLTEGVIKLLSSGSGASVGPIIEAIVAMWEENLGVTVELSQEEFGLFLRDVDEGNFQMFDLGWIADYVDAQNFLDIKFHSASANNETGYTNAEVDALLEEARTEQDGAKRLEVYQQTEEVIVQDAPWIPLYHSKSNALIKPYIQDYFIAPFVIPNLRY